MFDVVSNEGDELEGLSPKLCRYRHSFGEQKIRMVKVKVSGCFRTRFFAEAWCSISSYLSSMAALGYNPLVAIQIALAGNAADMVKLHDTKPNPRKG